MTVFLRFIGLLNAAVWCGSAIFVTVGLPAVFSPELKRLITPAGTGYAAEFVIARYFAVQYWCAGIALLHLLAEWFYFGKPLRRLNLGIILTVLLLALLGGLWAQPKMRVWHVIKYFGRSPEAQAQAAKSFAAWHAASMTTNLLVIAGLVWYLWRVNREQGPERFVSLSKMRG